MVKLLMPKPDWHPMRLLVEPVPTRLSWLNKRFDGATYVAFGAVYANDQTRQYWFGNIETSNQKSMFRSVPLVV
jgi:hypothetical protein